MKHKQPLILKLKEHNLDKLLINLKELNQLIKRIMSAEGGFKLKGKSNFKKAKIVNLKMEMLRLSSLEALHKKNKKNKPPRKRNNRVQIEICK